MMPRRPQVVAIQVAELDFHIEARLQAVDGETRADDEGAPLVDLGQTSERILREGGQPRARVVEASMVDYRPRLPVKTQLIGDMQARRPRLELIGVPIFDIDKRDGVKREHKTVAWLLAEPGMLDRGSERANIARVLGISLHNRR